MTRKILLGALGLGVLIFIIGIITQGGINQQGRLKLTLVPSDMTLTIDGKPVTGNEFELKSGSHKLTGKRQGFGDKTITVDVKTSQTTTKEFFLGANSELGMNYLINHPLEGALTSAQSSKDFDRRSEAAMENTPFIRELPQYGPDFRIDYGASEKHTDKEGIVGIYIKALTPTARQNALELIRQLGYDPSDMEIIFTSLTGQEQ